MPNPPPSSVFASLQEAAPKSGLTAEQPHPNPWEKVRFDDVAVDDEPAGQAVLGQSVPHFPPLMPGANVAEFLTTFLSGAGECSAGSAFPAQPPARDAAAAMVNLRDRVELVAERVARQVGVLNDAKMEAFGHVQDLEELDGSSFEETLNGRIGLLEFQLDRLENTIVHFGTTR